MDIKRLEKTSHNFKGKMVITDPCYVLKFKDDPDFWKRFCRTLFEGDDQGVIFDLEGTKIFVCGTNWGDGEYPVVKNDIEVGKCRVDAGLLSVIPRAFAKKHGFDRWDLVTVIDGGFTEATGNGNFKCGDYQILTDGEWEQEKQDEEDRLIEEEREKEEAEALEENENE